MAEKTQLIATMKTPQNAETNPHKLQTLTSSLNVAIEIKEKQNEQNDRQS